MDGVAKEGHPNFNPRPGQRLNPGPHGWQSEIFSTALTSHTKQERHSIRLSQMNGGKLRLFSEVDHTWSETIFVITACERLVSPSTSIRSHAPTSPPPPPPPIPGPNPDHMRVTILQSGGFGTWSLMLGEFGTWSLMFGGFGTWSLMQRGLRLVP